jgi:hypothetical protein
MTHLASEPPAGGEMPPGNFGIARMLRVKAHFKSSGSLHGLVSGGILAGTTTSFIEAQNALQPVILTK